MITLQVAYLIVNSVFLTLILILTFRIIRAASIFTYELGNEEIQVPMKWRILKSLVAMITIGLIASLFNLIVQP